MVWSDLHLETEQLHCWGKYFPMTWCCHYHVLLWLYLFSSILCFSFISQTTFFCCFCFWRIKPNINLSFQPWGRRTRHTVRMLLWWSGPSTVLSWTMTVLTVFRSVSKLHKPVWGQRLRGLMKSHSTLDKYNITKKALWSAWKGLHWVKRLLATKGSWVVATFCSRPYSQKGWSLVWSTNITCHVFPKLFWQPCMLIT